MRQVKEATKIPIANGENYYLCYGFREILEKGSLDGIALDLQKVGALLKG
jgi:galactonate dehydratase